MSQKSSPFLSLLDGQHYAPVEFPLDAEKLGSAANAFLQFLRLPDDVKRQLHFPARSHRASADGYTDKSTVDRKDPKQFFHWSPLLLDKVATTKLVQTSPDVANFMQQAASLYNQIEQVLFALYQQELPEHIGRIFREEKLIDGILRFLCYAPRQEHSFCAQAHFDKGFSTLALADSAPGLRIGCCNAHPLREVRYQSGTALFMPAWMLFQASQGKIKPAWHDVIHAPEEQNVNGFCARWSMVFFVNDPSATFSTWDELHTPLH